MFANSRTLPHHIIADAASHLLLRMLGGFPCSTADCVAMKARHNAIFRDNSLALLILPFCAVRVLGGAYRGGVDFVISAVEYDQ